MLSKDDHWFQLAILVLKAIIFLQLLKNGGSFLNVQFIPGTIVENLQYNKLQTHALLSYFLSNVNFNRLLI